MGFLLVSRMIVATALVGSLDKSYPWVVGFLFGNTELPWNYGRCLQEFWGSTIEGGLCVVPIAEAKVIAGRLGHLSGGAEVAVMSGINRGKPTRWLKSYSTPLG